MLEYDPLWGRYRVISGAGMIGIARKQLEFSDRAGVEVEEFKLPAQFSPSFSLGNGFNGQLECYIGLNQDVNRKIDYSQSQLLRTLLGGGIGKIKPMTEASFSSTIGLATQYGINDTFGIAAALHLIAPSIDQELQVLADAIQARHNLPWLHCTFRTHLALAPALTTRITALDQAREKAGIEIAKIAITTPLDAKRELKIRLQHYQSTFAALTDNTARELPAKLEGVSSHLSNIIGNFQPAARQQLCITLQRPSIFGGIFRRVMNFLNAKSID